MSIEVRCTGCGRLYRVADESAGKQVKCKACEAIITIPAAPIAVGATKPPPLPPSLAVAALPPKPPPLPYPPSAPNSRQIPYPPVAPTVFPTATSSSFWRTHRVVLIIVAVLVFAIFVTGAYFSYRAVRRMMAMSPVAGSPAASYSDSQLQSKLAGTWSGTQHSASGPVSATLILRSNGTYDTRLIVGGRLADLGGTWDIQNHLVNITITTIRTGDPAAAGKKLHLGYVKDVTDTKLVLGTDNGDETYQRGQSARVAMHSTPPPSSTTGPSMIRSNPSPPPAQHSFSPRRQSSAAVTLPPAPAGLTGPGPWRDLLANLDAAKGTVSGDWKLDQGTLTGSSAQGFARLKLAPPEATSLELEITFNRRSGTKEFCVVFPAGQHPAQLSMGGMGGQTSAIEGGARVHDGAPITNNSDQVLRLIVKPADDNASVEVTLDGRPYLSFTGTQSRLHVSRMEATDDPNVISLAVHQQTTVDFKQIRVRTIPAK